MKRFILAVIIILVAARIIYHEFTDPETRIETYVNFFTKEGGRFPEVFRAQIILESARLNSNVFKENNKSSRYEMCEGKTDILSRYKSDICGI
jgi:hypothetical protein